MAYRDLSARLRALILGGLGALVLIILLSPFTGAMGAVPWTRAELTFASAISLIAALLSIQGTTGRVRAVRSWITMAIAFWLVGEVLRDVKVAFGNTSALKLSDLPFIGVLLCAGVAYVSALKGQLRPSEELAVYLDGATVFFATAALMLTMFGQATGQSPTNVVDLAYAIFFLATTGATLLLDLAVRAERRPHGAYVVLVGLVLVGIGFLWRVASPQPAELHEPA